MRHVELVCGGPDGRPPRRCAWPAATARGGARDGMRVLSAGGAPAARHRDRAAEGCARARSASPRRGRSSPVADSVHSFVLVDYLPETGQALEELAAFIASSQSAC